LKGHLSLSFCIQFFKQCVNINFQRAITFVKFFIIFKDLDIIVEYQNFTFLIQFGYWFLEKNSFIYCSDIRNLDIKNSKIHLPTMVGAGLFFLGEKSPKNNILCFKRTFFWQVFFF